MTKLLAAVLSTMFLIATASAQSPGAKLQGVWKIVEERTTGPTAMTYTNLQPSLLIVTAKHYSILRITSAAPRPNLPADVSKATAAELMAVWQPLTANAGTYEVTGDKVTQYPIVAKNPDVMAKGAKQVSTFKLEGNTLWLTSVSNTSGPIANPTTFKYVRVE